MVKRPRTIRFSLLRDFVVVIVVLAAAILLTTMLGARHVVERMSGELTNQSLDQTGEKLDAFFAPAEELIELGVEWGRKGRLDINDHVGLRRLVTPMLMRNPQLSTFLLADESGREFMLLRMEDGWRVRRIGCDECGEKPMLMDYALGEERPRISDQEEPYDPRDRPWFRGAMATASKGEAAIFWTEPYQFFTTKQPGITASRQFAGADGRKYIVGVDMLLSDVCEFTTNLKVGESGFVVVLTRNREVIGLPSIEAFGDPASWGAYVLQEPEALPTPVMTNAVATFQRERRRSGDEQRSGRVGPARFHSGGEAWWGQATDYHLTDERSLLLAVALPERDLIGSLTLMRWLIGAAFVLVLVAAILRAVVVSRRVSRPIEALVAQSDRISQGDLEPGEAIRTSFTEVANLAGAQERMRQGLQTLMKLERDLQLARQIQQSTFPKKLPKVEGYDVAAWSEPADETGGDTYDVIHYTLQVMDLRGPGGSGVEGKTRSRKKPDEDDGRRVVFLLADATGHGIGPALSVTQVRAMLRMAARFGRSTEDIAREMNEQLHDDLPADRFVTVWMGELHPERNELVSMSAGQGPLLLYRAATKSVESMNADAPPLGVTEELMLDKPQTIRLEPGDIFAVLSDGLFEAMNPRNELFGQKRVMACLKAHAEKRAGEMLKALKQEIATFSEGRPAADDQTAIVIKRKEG